MDHDVEDLNVFLKNVDTISEIVKELNSSDVLAQQKAIEKADLYITNLEADAPCREKINKTKINSTNPYLPDTASMVTQTDMCQEAFIKTMERDAEERRIWRKAKEKIAKEFKDKGNDAYARQDYEIAVKCYSDGLAELRDMQPLYTNRAQAYIKLGRYRDAIHDCEWALKCDEKCIKAYLHMGKAYLALGDYSESRNCFEKIVEIEPGREKMIKEYLTQVDLEEGRKSAREEIVKGEEVATVTHPMEKPSVPK